MATKRVSIGGTRSRTDTLHVEAPGCIVNIFCSLTDRHGRRVTRIEITGDEYSGAAPWYVEGEKGRRHLSARLIECTPDAPATEAPASVAYGPREAVTIAAALSSEARAALKLGRYETAYHAAELAMRAWMISADPISILTGRELLSTTREAANRERAARGAALIGESV